ncbi:MAG: heavy-metal-associated domain-containing protein [Candidatus Tectimicrobiota bacterium]
MTKTTIAIEGMTCGHCVATVTEGLKALDGVHHVDVSLEAGRAVVEYDEARLDPQAIRAKVAELGYRAP